MPGCFTGNIPADSRPAAGPATGPPMAADLPDFPLDQFTRSVAALSPEPLAPPVLAALYGHYTELRRWNRGLALVGAGTAGEVLERHYGESLAALPWVPEGAENGLDIGSGAGFPGLVIAAARPGLRMTLVEARERKWSFLLAAARRISLSCRCLNARVHAPLPADLPEDIDLVTARAVKLDPEVLAELAGRLRPGGRILLWAGESDPDLPPGLAVAGQTRLGGSERRRILALRRKDEDS